MSKRDKSRLRQRPSPGGRPETLAHSHRGPSQTIGASWAATAAMLALSLLFGGIAWSMIARPTSMVGAMAHAEQQAISRTALDRDLQSVFRNAKLVGSRLDVDLILCGVLLAPHNRAEADALLRDCQGALERTQSNLLSRLGYAAMVDRVEHGRPTASHPASASAAAPPRFHQMQAVVEGLGPANPAELYIGPIVAACEKAVQRHVDRPDVAIAIAGMQAERFRANPSQHAWLDDIRHAEWHAIPAIFDQIGSLAASLRENGAIKEADAAERWLARCALDLLANEPEASTQLICAELLSTLWRSSHPAWADAALAFRRAFHDAADAAHVDLCGQSFISRPSVAPIPYRKALFSLAFASALAAIGIGAGLAAFLAIITSLLLWARAKWRRAPGTASTAFQFTKLPAWKLLALSTLSCAALAALTIARLAGDVFYNETSLVVLGLILAAAGATAAMFLSAARTTPRRIGWWITIAGLALFIIALALPIASHAWFGRTIALTLGTELLLIPLLIGLAATCAIASCASPRTIASSTALVAFSAMTLSVLSTMYHATADRAYQRAAADGYRDETAARLGTDWMQRYFGDAQKALTDPRR